MKNAISSLSLLAFVALMFSSCKKDLTLKDQVVGKWKSVEIKAGQDDISGSNTFDLNLEVTDEFELDITTFIPISGNITQSYNGDWEIDEAKQDIKLIYNDDDNTTKTWEIISIANSTLQVEFYENNVRYQVKYQRQ